MHRGLDLKTWVQEPQGLYFMRCNFISDESLGSPMPKCFFAHNETKNPYLGG